MTYWNTMTYRNVGGRFDTMTYRNVGRLDNGIQECWDDNDMQECWEVDTMTYTGMLGGWD